MKNYKNLGLSVLLMLLSINKTLAQSGSEDMSGGTYGTSKDIYVINSDEGENDAALRLQTFTDVDSKFNDWTILNERITGDLSFSVYRSDKHTDDDETKVGDTHLKMTKDGVVSVSNQLRIGKVADFSHDVSLLVFGTTHIAPKENYASIANIALQEGLSEYQLVVEQGIVSDSFYLANVGSWADYVFSKDYKMADLESVEKFINKNGHLPDVPSEKEVLSEGYSLHDMNVTFLKKIEELTLYTIAHRKLLEQLLLNAENN